MFAILPLPSLELSFPSLFFRFRPSMLFLVVDTVLPCDSSIHVRWPVSVIGCIGVVCRTVQDWIWDFVLSFLLMLGLNFSWRPPSLYILLLYLAAYFLCVHVFLYIYVFHSCVGLFLYPSPVCLFNVQCLCYLLIYGSCSQCYFNLYVMLLRYCSLFYYEIVCCLVTAQ